MNENLMNEQFPIYLEKEHVETKDTHANIAHWHEDIEIIYVTKGNMMCQVNDETFHLQKGDVCFINRKQIHHLTPEEKTDSEHRVLIVKTSLLSCNHELYEEFVKPMLEDQTYSHIRFEGNSSPAGQIGESITRIEQLKEEAQDGYVLDMYSELYQIVGCLYRAYKQAPKNQHALDPRYYIQQAMTKYIEENYRDKIGLDDIASAGNVSRSQATKMFNYYTGLSPISYLNEYRLERSRELLRSSSQSVADIAMDCGFLEPSYYNRLFLREYGVTPKQYRKGQ